jgi:hypothetical protein
VGPAGRFEGADFMTGANGPLLVARGALVPLPTEPVGIGARWRVRSRLVGSPAMTFEVNYSFVDDANGRSGVHATIFANLISWSALRQRLRVALRNVTSMGNLVRHVHSEPGPRARLLCRGTIHRTERRMSIHPSRATG